MKKNTNNIMLISAGILLFNNLAFAHKSAKEQLYQQYEYHCNESSDIKDHVPVLRKLAAECASAAEIGLRDMVSTWGVLQGLSENNLPSRLYIGIDLECPPATIFNLAKDLAKSNSIAFKFVQANDMDIDIEPVELLFIDSLHTYCHLTYELEKFSPKVGKYIAMHDTSEPWGYINDFQQYHGDYSEYPAHYDRTKKGLWAAVEDFLNRHPEWKLHDRRFTSHGLTVLKRIAK